MDSLHGRSSVFLLCGSRSTPEPTGEYILQARENSQNAAPGLRDLSELGLPRLRPSQLLAAAVSRALSPAETTFFADLPGLTSLVCHVLPALMSNRQHSQKLRIWCPHCATGQGTYSLAITLAELCPRLAHRNIEIVASDADAASLARARRGIYGSQQVQRGLPTEWLLRHFEQLPAGGGWRFSSHLAGQMTWLHLNLSQSYAAVGAADVIFCHRKVGSDELGRMPDQLGPNGFLILGSAEAGLERDSRLERVCDGDSVYRRVSSEELRLSA